VAEKTSLKKLGAKLKFLAPITFCVADWGGAMSA